MSTLLDAALYYASLGWKVIPLHNIENGKCTCGNPDCNGSSGKHPRLADWPGEATTDPAKIKFWWTAWPRANVGVTGQMVIDSDGPKGAESLAGKEWPRTPTVITGKGKHYHFKWPDVGFEIKNEVGILPGIDIRVAKGQVVMPPSEHFSGRKYEWEIPPTDCQLADLPNWFLAILEEKAFTRLRNPAPPDVYDRMEAISEGGDRLKAYADAALDKELAELLKQGEGTRNNQLNRASFSLGQLVGAGGLDRHEVQSALYRAARAIGLPESEARGTIESGMRAGMADPRSLPEELPPTSKKESKAPLRFPVSYDDHSLTDIGNAERLVNQHGEDMRFSQLWKKWLVWNGRYWQIDESNRAKNKGIETAKTIFAEAAEAGSKEKSREIGGWALASASRGKIEAMLDLSKGYLAVSPDELDRDPWLINCLNGTLDLRSGILKAHDRADYITKSVDLEYDPEAEAPCWIVFIRRTFGDDQELIRYIQKSVGYTLTGVIKEQIWYLCYGTGQNGKSTFINALLFVMGKYGITAKFDTFQVQRSEGVRNDLADMKGCRIVAAIEAKQGKRLDETVLKQLTGEDRIRARHLYAEFEEFVPSHKLWLIANHKPTVHETTKAFWRRVRLIPFLVTIPDAEVDKDLNNKLEAEAEGILAWMVEGCKLWQKEGLHPPAKVVDATAEYREEMDVLGGFIDDLLELTFDWNDRIQSGTLYEHYNVWCQEQAKVEGEAVTPISRKLFGMKLTERGLKRDKIGGMIFWLGMKFKAISPSQQDHQDHSNRYEQNESRTIRPLIPISSPTHIELKECESKIPMVLDKPAVIDAMVLDGPAQKNIFNGQLTPQQKSKFWQVVAEVLRKTPRKDGDKIGVAPEDVAHQSKLTGEQVSELLQKAGWTKESVPASGLTLWWAPSKDRTAMGA